MDTKLKSFTCDKIHLMMIILTEVGALTQSTCSGGHCHLPWPLYRYIWTDVYILSLPQERTRFVTLIKHRQSVE